MRFHIYWNSYTMFKGAWAMEGTAKWAEYVIGAGTRGTNADIPLPSTMAQMDEVFAHSLPMWFWDRLILLVDASPDSIIHLPPSVAGLTYVDGTPIMKDNKFRGAALIKAYLQALDAEDDVVTAVNGLAQYRWAESYQSNPIHRPRILKALQRAVRNTGATGAEIDAFLAIQ